LSGEIIAGPEPKTTHSEDLAAVAPKQNLVFESCKREINLVS
jgi:hypothetical protein